MPLLVVRALYVRRHNALDKMKARNTTHKGHQIRVENGWFSGERLIVDGETQDERRGFAFRRPLSVRIRTVNGARELISGSLERFLSESGWGQTNWDLVATADFLLVFQSLFRALFALALPFVASRSLQTEIRGVAANNEPDPAPAQRPPCPLCQ